VAVIIGIDLGTTNSLAGVWDAGSVRIIPNALGLALTPSAVSIDADGAVLVGQPALERLHTHPERSAARFKRYMGSNKEFTLAGQRFRPEELSALVLKSLKQDVEAALGQMVSRAVITVPAYFSDVQRKATHAAGELAGLEVVALLNEPTAAALAHGMNQRGGSSRFLVFDLGGGTFDVSVLEWFEGVMEVRASTGDNFLGGEDFVDAMAKAFCIEHGIKVDALNPTQQERLWAACEAAKRTLSMATSAEIALEVAGSMRRSVIDETRFAQIAQPLLDRLRTPVERALRDARIRAAELDEIVLAGGATRMPLVRKLVSRMFGRFPSTQMNPDEVVALGAAVQAGLRMDDVALTEVMLTDVCPYSLGIETARELAPNEVQSGLFSPIIERNTIVPVSRMERYYTMHENQSQIELKVFQGESRNTADNIALGQMTIDVPKKPRGEMHVDVRFTYNSDGILEVECEIPDGKPKRSMVISSANHALSPEEIRERLARLADLKVHPRDNMANRQLLAQADRLYQEAKGDLRRWIGDAATHFEATLLTQDPVVIRRAASEFAQVLEEAQESMKSQV
jgi:molecular chaperone HscC